MKTFMDIWRERFEGELEAKTEEKEGKLFCLACAREKRKTEGKQCKCLKCDQEDRLNEHLTKMIKDDYEGEDFR